MERIEMVEKVCEKANVTMEEAKAALERNNWDLLDTMVELERQGRTGQMNMEGAKASTERTYRQEYEQVNPTASRGESGNGTSTGKEVLQKIWDKLVELFHKSLRNSFVVSKKEEVLVRFPVLILVLLALGAFWLTLIILIAGLFLDLRYSFQGRDLGSDSINDTMSKATDFAQELVREVKEGQKNDSQKNDSEGNAKK